MKMKRIAALFLGFLLSFLLAANCIAKEVENEKVYNPLDLVVVIDSSGSMNDSDPSKTALDAVRMLVNMMPAKDSRVGIVSFNRSASVLTKNTSGADSLISLEEFSGVETIRSDVSNIKYNGGTGIGNALIAATDLLNKSSDHTHTKAIILFTDGVNDFGYNKIAAAKCDENELNAIMWAKDNNCCIYCVGYDYITPSGESSMGVNGEGLKKLKSISDSTEGKFKTINNISDIEQLLIDFLADVCDLNYKTVATIPGDGGKHECTIPVSPSVIEANIRITGGKAGSIKNGDIRLYDPSGKEIQLRNSGNVRYDADATAASIKVIMPAPGDWILSVNGISGEDIHVGLLEHFKMNLTSQLILPAGNPEGVAYENDEVGIKTWLSYDGKAIQDNDLYDAVTSAKATCVSRADPDDIIEVPLKRNGKSFEGRFIIPKDSYYDITVRLDWDTVYREDSSLEIKSIKPPLAPNGNIKNIKVNKGKTISIDNIFSYVISSDNDLVTVRVKNMTNEDAAKLSINDDKLDVTGVKGWWAKTYVTLEYKDQQGNTVEQSFKVSVGDPWAWIIVVSLLILILVIVIAILIYLRKISQRIKGSLYIEQIIVEDMENDISEYFMYDGNGPMIVLNKYTRDKNYHSILGIIKDVRRFFDNNDIGSSENIVYEYLTTDRNGKKLLTKCEKTKIIGSVLGDCFTIKKSKKTKYLTINKKDRGRIRIDNNKNLVLSFKENDPQTQRCIRKIEIEMYFRSPVRTRIHKRRK